MHSRAAKERDWVDYANLGSNLLQNLQLRDTQRKLGAIASIAVEQQAVTNNENERREIVFQANNNLRGMRALVAKTGPESWSLQNERWTTLGLTELEPRTSERTRIRKGWLGFWRGMRRLRRNVPLL